MEPLEIALSLELGSLILAAVVAAATWIHHRHQSALHRQRERHHQAMCELQQRGHRERLAALDQAKGTRNTVGGTPTAQQDVGETVAEGDTAAAASEESQGQAQESEPKRHSRHRWEESKPEAV